MHQPHTLHSATGKVDDDCGGRQSYQSLYVMYVSEWKRKRKMLINRSNRTKERERERTQARLRETWNCLLSFASLSILYRKKNSTIVSFKKIKSLYILSIHVVT